MSRTPGPGKATQFVTIGIDREILAIAVDHVREILDMQPITRLPNAPRFLAGMIDVRGESVPTIDLRLKLGLPAAAVTPHTRILVLDVPLEGESLTLGMIADRVIEVTSLSERALEPPPKLGIAWRSDYISAIGRANGELVIVFDLPRLFAGDAPALLEESGAGVS